MKLDKEELAKEIEIWKEKLKALKEYPFEDKFRTEREIYNLQCLLDEAKEAMANGGNVPWQKFKIEHEGGY